jgi:Na+/melibiose symporter-like transporter
MFSMFLLLYYTDVAGITAAAAGTLHLAVRATPSPTYSLGGWST